ncbi:hypothetical protein M422DRAFT_274147 [Sphaerobolus stellatus SS14]|uniref:Uncharacterized protein n=1 Tax=Sphaerobolus stellatus (strain SS14) TaxID=990650 RepID=A0A0C9UID9_SPHS4|nr:hypothetical protein M422DRAFT_274147 [Sphaerobolus stellatus SS14]
MVGFSKSKPDLEWSPEYTSPCVPNPENDQRTGTLSLNQDREETPLQHSQDFLARYAGKDDAYIGIDLNRNDWTGDHWELLLLWANGKLGGKKGWKE